jgi:hypothetical protein
MRILEAHPQGEVKTGRNSQPGGERIREVNCQYGKKGL